MICYAMLNTSLLADAMKIRRNPLSVRPPLESIIGTRVANVVSASLVGWYVMLDTQHEIQNDIYYELEISKTLTRRREDSCLHTDVFPRKTSYEKSLYQTPCAHEHSNEQDLLRSKAQ